MKKLNSDHCAVNVLTCVVVLSRLYWIAGNVGNLIMIFMTIIMKLDHNNGRVQVIIASEGAPSWKVEWPKKPKPSFDRLGAI